MITKESEIFFTDKQQSFVNVNNYDNVNIYNSNSNLNLNANYKSLSVSSVQSYCKKTTSGKSSDSYDIGINEGHKRFQKYKKSDLSYVLNERQVQQMFENRRKDFSKKDFFEKDSLNVNSSTLSLHIAAYENSMETSYANECNEADGFKNKGGNTGLKWKNLKQIFTGSTLIVQVNPFEFSRQKNNQNNKPEVMQFKSSQRLLNPNLSESNSLGYIHFKMAQKVRAAYDFDAQPGSGELTIRENEILTVIRENIEGGWIEGRNAKGQVGLFPESYVNKIQSMPSAPPPSNPPPPLPPTYAQPPASNILPPLPAQFGAPPPSLHDDWADPRVPTTPVYPVLPEASLPNPASAPSLPHQALAPTQSAAQLHEDDFDDDWSDEDEEVAEIQGGNVGAGAVPQQRQVSRSRSAGPDTISNSGKPGASRMKTINRFSNFVKSGMESYILTQSKMASEPGERHEVIIKDGRIMWAPPLRQYTCLVDKPKKESKLKGLKSFIAYSVTSSLTNIQVSRRYKHFDWLHEQLSNKYLLIPIPPLPEKQVSGRYEEDLIEHRKCILQLWVDKICRHPVLSQSEVWQHFITTTDEKKWKNGKRTAEKDEYVGGNFFNCVTVPSQPVDSASADKQVESFVKSVRSLDESIKNFYVCITETQKRLVGPYKANWQKMAAALDGLGQSFQLDHSSAPVKSAIAQSANVLHKIGAQHEEHGKTTTEQLMDFIYTYKGVLSGIPDVVNIHKSAFAKLSHNDRLMMEGKLSPQEADAIHRRVEVITYAMLAEINHISQEANDDFRLSLGTYFAKEADFYTNIGQQLGKLADQFKK